MEPWLDKERWLRAAIDEAGSEIALRERLLGRDRWASTAQAEDEIFDDVEGIPGETRRATELAADAFSRGYLKALGDVRGGLEGALRRMLDPDIEMWRMIEDIENGATVTLTCDFQPQDDAPPHASAAEAGSGAAR